jgi:anti-anti-sigma factor
MEAPSFVITLSGELDLSNVAEMRSSLADALGPAAVDLSAVTYLDSTALYELGALRKRVGNVVLIAPSPQIRRTLEIVGYTKIFDIVDDRAQIEAG